MYALILVSCAGLVVTTAAPDPNVETPYVGTEEGCKAGVWYVDREPVKVVCTGDPFWFLALLNAALGDYEQFRSDNPSVDLHIGNKP